MSNEVITFGCRLNFYESEVIKSNLQKAHLDNVAVFNTCAVTKEAERQAKQAIRKYKRENPDKKILVTGCASQIDKESYQKITEVDFILGNQEKLEEKSYNFATDSEKIKVNDIMAVKETASHLVAGFESHARAFMQIQNGCNHRCTFCIIPYGRGNSRSVPISQIIKQAEILVKQGYNEVVLTGVDISDYGKDLPGKPTLGNMIKRLFKMVPDLPRLRLSSVDVAEIDEDILDLLKYEECFMPHLHLSLQAGDDMILKRMKRRHNRKQVLEFCDRARNLRNNIAFGADIITGFPTESDEMFQNTADIVSEANLTYLHVFPYSEREGTPAAKIPTEKQVPVKLRKERAKILRDLGEKQYEKLFNSIKGTKQKVIVEQNNKGRTEQFLSVDLQSDFKIGELVEIIV